ncbi:unnamed protein product [Anisakis simplex]|uniref:Xaa-Pro dipeptidase n=1 Tax=Anisakis simplex TaxID=6269 RepID=A0A0M3JH84_ANISI|nr:unnamed protein product [Anisakis simplex]
MSIDTQYNALAKYIDDNKKKFIERLSEAVAIPSISAEVKHRADVIRMMEWAKEVFYYFILRLIITITVINHY